jgi:hypothetical protein
MAPASGRRPHGCCRACRRACTTCCAAHARRETVVARQAIRSAGQVLATTCSLRCRRPRRGRTWRPTAAEALARYGPPVVPTWRRGCVTPPRRPGQARAAAGARADRQRRRPNGAHRQPAAARRHRAPRDRRLAEHAPGGRRAAHRSRSSSSWCSRPRSPATTGPTSGSASCGRTGPTDPAVDRAGPGDGAGAGADLPADEALAAGARRCTTPMSACGRHPGHQGQCARAARERAQAGAAQLVLPLIDSHVTLEERAARANRLVGGPRIRPSRRWPRCSQSADRGCGRAPSTRSARCAARPRRRADRADGGGPTRATRSAIRWRCIAPARERPGGEGWTSARQSGGNPGILRIGILLSL